MADVEQKSKDKGITITVEISSLRQERDRFKREAKEVTKNLKASEKRRFVVTQDGRPDLDLCDVILIVSSWMVSPCRTIPRCSPVQ